MAQRQNEQVMFALGDISGKGISAALLMATIHSAVRAYEFGRVLEPAQLVTTAVVLLNGTLVGALVVGTFEALISIVNTGVLW